MKRPNLWHLAIWAVTWVAAGAVPAIFMVGKQPSALIIDLGAFIWLVILGVIASRMLADEMGWPA